MWDKIFRSDSIAARQVVPDKRERQNGDLVLELNPNRKWTQWGMALITNVFPDKDGLVRKVRIKTQNGEHDRPTHKQIGRASCRERV